MGTVGKCREQGLVGKDVDSPSQAFGSIGDQSRCRGAEYIGATIAGRAHAELKIFGHVVADQGLQIEIMGNPFLELAHVRAGQDAVQLRLPEQDQLQQLVAVRLKI